MIRVDVALKLGAFNLDVAFENGAGITAFFGRSGSGKSMTINLIAGLKRPERGSIVLDGRVLVDTEAHIFVPAYRRRVGLVFQDAQLFPHLSVRQNLLFGRWFAPKAAASIPFAQAVGTLGIGHLLERKPGRLSGGEKQRVAMGRARLASRVVVLDNGHVVAAGTVEDVLGPGLSGTGLSRFARSSVVTGRLAAVDAAYDLTEISHPAGTIWLTGRAGPIGREARVVVRATDITLAKARPQNLSVRTTLAGTIAGIEADADGPLAGVSIDLEGHGHLFALATRKAIDELALRPGDRVFALVKSVALDERAVAAVET